MKECTFYQHNFLCKLNVNQNTTWTLVERIQSFLALTDLEEFSPTDLMKNTGIAELLPESVTMSILSTVAIEMLPPIT